MIRRLLIVLALIGLVALPACGKRETDIDEVRDAIKRTRDLANQFVYSEQRLYADERERLTTEVRGAVEDDFRFKARVSYNGTVGFDQVVSDDALAVRLVDVARIAQLVDKQTLGTADQTTAIKGLSTLDILRTRRWVLDPSGAPQITAASTEKSVGQDPVFDALTALDYVDAALGQAYSVEEWSEDDLSPVYSKTEDTFKRPGADSKVTRYDLRRPFLPTASEASGGATGDAALPATKNFRKMAIYVQDGRIVQVVEKIEATGKVERDLTKYLRNVLKELKAPERVRNELEGAIARFPEGRRGPMLLGFLNGFLTGAGEEPVLVRTMSLDLSDLGQPTPVALPTAEVVEGRLDALVVSGASKRAKAQVEGGESSVEDGSAGQPPGSTPPGG